MPNKKQQPHQHQDNASQGPPTASTLEHALAEHQNGVPGEALIDIARALARQAAREFFHANISTEKMDGI